MGAGRARVTGLKSAGRAWPLVVRRARAEDRAAVLDFASRTWDGWDYVPHAWPFWLTADDGVLLVATAGPTANGAPPLDRDGTPLETGRPLALARVALTGPGEAWLEGIRVDPRVRGMDVATDLQVAELAWAAAQPASVVRYATGETNEGSHRLGARHGFRLLASFRTYWWSASQQDENASQSDSGFDDSARAAANAERGRLLERLAAAGLVASPDTAAEWWSLLRRDDTFLAAQRLYEHRAWALQELTEAGFARHAARGELIVSGASGAGDASRGDASDASAGDASSGSWALAILERDALPAEDTSLHLGLLVGESGTALELLSRMQAAAESPLRFRLPADDPPVMRGHARPLAERGFRAREWTLHILGRELEPGTTPPEPSESGLVLQDEPAPIIRAPGSTDDTLAGHRLW